VPDREPGNPIKEDPRRGGGEESHDPITEPTRKAPLLKEVHNVIPPHVVKGFANVEFKKKRRSLALV
jgi:hypothetical protein